MMHAADVLYVSQPCGCTQVLQLEPGSDAKSIKATVRTLARKVHPDKCSLPGGAEAFKAVIEAAEHVSTSDTGLSASHNPTHEKLAFRAAEACVALAVMLPWACMSAKEGFYDAHAAQLKGAGDRRVIPLHI